MHELIRLAFKVSLIVFMVGNLSSMGLQLDFHDAVRPLRQPRFVFTALLASFVFSPTLAFLITKLFPVEQPYAVGLLLLGLAPTAPFLPLVVKNARGDLSAAAALMMLASLGTILLMPLAVPHIVPGATRSARTVARPLLLLVLLPLLMGMAVRYRSIKWADHLFRYDKTITNTGTVLFLAIVLLMNVRVFLGAVGSYAFAVQFLFVVSLTIGGYFFAIGLPPAQRSVMSLGMCTRNIGAAAAIVGSGGDQRVMVMLVIGTLATGGISFAAASWFRSRSDPIPRTDEAIGSEAQTNLILEKGARLGHPRN
jgi:BASS family bile acid:Na+ symporter